MLTFNPPRTTTKAEWASAHRCERQLNRVVEARLSEIEVDLGLRMTNLFVYGTTHPEVYL